MTPLEMVQSEWGLPFTPYWFQAEAIDDLADKQKGALYFEPGLGKTVTATCIALNKLMKGADTVLVIMPPQLITQWGRWLSKIKGRDGSPPKVVAYRGTPTQRAALDLNADFVLMGIQIFKRDIANISSKLGEKTMHVILDEAQCIKDVGTANYKTYRDFVETQSHTLLTGTPLNNPMDAYAYVKLIAPNVYRNLHHFEQVHVVERDFFGNPTGYGNLDLLKENLLVNAHRRTKEEVLLDLPPCTVVPIAYDLAPRHLDLYRQLADEQLLKLPDGGKIDATQVTALYHALGQIVCNWGYFAQDESKVAQCFSMIDMVLDEIGSAKLVVFSNYKMTNRAIMEMYDCPGVWGEISAKEKDRAIDKFITDPTCRLITMNPRAGGVGVDGLQHVCTDVLYVEPPIAVMHWTQSLSRIHREGQTLPVTVRMLMALGTIQEHLVASLTEKEDLVNPLQGSKAMLREAIFGSLKPRQKVPQCAL